MPPPTRAADPTAGPLDADGYPVSDSHRRFFGAALELLAEEGYGALKLGTICRRVGVTTGAFYHAFDGWADFTEKLLSYWHQERTIEISSAAAAEPDPVLRLDVLVRAALDLEHRAERAIRTWAGVDPAVRKLQERVDRERVETVTDAFLAVTGDPAYSRRLARAAYYMLVGYEQAEAERDSDTLQWAMELARQLATTSPLP